MTIKEQAYYVGLNLKHLRQQNITTSSTAKTDREQTRSVRSQERHICCAHHAHILRICTAVKVPSPSHQTKSWRMRSVRDSLTQNQSAWRMSNRKTLSVKKLLADDKLERDNGKTTQSNRTKRQDNRIRATSRCSTLVQRLQAQSKCTVATSKEFLLHAKCTKPKCQNSRAEPPSSYKCMECVFITLPSRNSDRGGR